VVFCPGSNTSNQNPSGGFYLIAYEEPWFLNGLACGQMKRACFL
jgi:hypothetical protein